MNNIYEKIDLFDSDEISIIKKLLLKKINSFRTNKISTIEDIHLYLNDEDELLKNKANRILSLDEIEEFQKLNGFIKLKQKFSNFEIGESVVDNKKLGYPEVYFRVVRPNKINDVGSIHADNWYHILADLKYHKGETYKVWISIVSEPNKNGLIFYPNSVNIDTKFEYINNKFIINEKIKDEKIMPAISPGQAFIFNDTILHQGSINNADTSRCSIEITFVPKSI
jgi:hypothetical protein